MEAYWLKNDGSPGETISNLDFFHEGIFHSVHPVDPKDYTKDLELLKTTRGYIHMDEVNFSPEQPDLEEVCDKFVDEHHHDEDEVRFILEGEGVFDIRSRDDRWMRVEVEQGDLLIIPAKRHHRFYLTDAKRIRALRLFKDPKGWVAYYRKAPPV
jgi:1,2-dihydroxy-3-keto-5-methylthiopentene dioxygenase